jgi:phosphotransferase system enzyme I (PtsI)
MTIIQGHSTLDAIGIGTIYFYTPDVETIRPYAIEDKEEELARFVWAKQEAKKQLDSLYQETAAILGESDAAIFEIHKMMLEEEDFSDSVENLIRTQNLNAEYAIEVTNDHLRKMFHSMEDPYMKERVVDVDDISQRLISILRGGERMFPAITQPCIVAAGNLVPSDTMKLPKKYVQGFAIRQGSENSHTTILAKNMGVPVILHLGEALSEEFDGHPAIIDGSKGYLYVDPEPDVVERLSKERDRKLSQTEKLLRLKGLPTVTKDGLSMQLLANVSNLEQVREAVLCDAEGIGLFRSEMYFLESREVPGEEAQFRYYRQILELMHGKPVTIRTLDMGADKMDRNINGEREENPALGLRGIRLSFARPTLFMTQLRALLRASIYGDLRILYPMITSIDEVQRIKEINERVKQSLRDANVPYANGIKHGIMIETPAAALISDELAKEVDFFSIGTNDLIQYTMAADRQNEAVSMILNPQHAAIDKLLEMTLRSAKQQGIPCTICGELASERTFTRRFLELGVDALSVSPNRILPMRAHILGL